jgi:predicted  nucleic acid-binding Zn ribbon protein
LGAKVVLRFIAADKIVSAADDNGQSTVEAAVDDVFIYDKTVTGVHDVAPAKANVYPNPANNEIRVSLSKNTKGSISLTDVTGKELMKLDVNLNNTEYTIPAKSLTNGTYMVTIRSDKSIQTSKVVVAH